MGTSTIGILITLSLCLLGVMGDYLLKLYVTSNSPP
jgi:hypothetical protein